MTKIVNKVYRRNNKIEANATKYNVTGPSCSESERKNKQHGIQGLRFKNGSEENPGNLA